jgi:hypothetical protein
MAYGLFPMLALWTEIAYCSGEGILRRAAMPFKRRLFAISIAAATITTAAFAADTEESRGIIVTGKSLNDTEADLKNCIARGCSPDEEIRAALAHAENQFITGEYRDAKTTLHQTVGRNRKFGGQYPIEVSDLFRARSRVAEHLGEPQDFKLAVLDMRDTLRDNLPADDARAMVAQIEVGESRAKLGYPKEAIRIFEDMEGKAIGANHNRVAAYAQLRRLLINYDMALDNDAFGQMKRAVAGLRQMADQPKAGAEDFAMVAEVALARLDRRAGKQGSTEAIIKRFAERGGANRPILLSAEPVKVPAGRNLKSGTEDLGRRTMAGAVSTKVVGSTGLQMTPGSFEDRWLDIGFWVNPNGLVSEVEVLRSSGDMYWAQWVSDAIKSRIYAPLSMKGREASPGFYMVERYTYTSRYLDRSATTGTRLQTRSPQARIERLDITPENYDQPFVTEGKPTE